MMALKIDFNEPDEALNEYFAINDLDSRLSIKNLGSTFFFLILYLFAWILFFISKLISQYSTK